MSRRVIKVLIILMAVTSWWLPVDRVITCNIVSTWDSVKFAIELIIATLWTSLIFVYKVNK